jgi:hypothetical protein
MGAGTVSEEGIAEIAAGGGTSTVHVATMRTLRLGNKLTQGVMPDETCVPTSLSFFYLPKK